MALPVEDQTDEDFFDKLVDNDYEVSESRPSFVDDGDSDEVNAFSNLNIGEVDTTTTTTTVSTADHSSEEAKISPSSDGTAIEKDILVPDDSASRGSSGSFIVHDTASEFNDVLNHNDVRSDNVMSASRNKNIKEVQWSAFGATDSPDIFTDPFAEVGGIQGPTFSGKENVVAESAATSLNSAQHQVGQAYGAQTEQTVDDQNWENMYPGWKYDSNTGQWYQVDDFSAPEIFYLGSSEGNVQATGDNLGSDQRSEVSYMQQTTQSAMGTVTDDYATNSVVNWNQVSQGVNTEYPANMVFDPQYPGWYYDTITQEWCLLESYNPTAQSTSNIHDQQVQNGNASAGGFYPDKDHNSYGEYGQVNSYGSESNNSQVHGGSWAGAGSVPANNYVQQNVNMWQPEMVAKNEAQTGFHTQHHKPENFSGAWGSTNSYPDQQVSTNIVTPSYEQMNQGYNGPNGNNKANGFQSFPAMNVSQQFNQPKEQIHQFNQPKEQIQQFNQPKEQIQQFNQPKEQIQQFNQPKVEQIQQMKFPNSFQNGSQFSGAANQTRSSAGRPPHALVNFGFGGKLIVMKDSSSFVTNTYGSQDNIGRSISLLNLLDIVVEKNDTTSTGVDYFRALCQQSLPGPLVGGNIGSKELNKWIDEKIANCDSSNMDYRKGELLRLLLSLLKIACQHYGKLRSPFGTDPALKGADCPESAVASLFASAKTNGAQLSGYGGITQCLQNLPSEGQIQATAAEVQNLLVSGRTQEALQCAQEGQLWGPALVLAAQLGNQFHVDTVKQMAQRQLIAGSPLRTLCLLIAGQPADVFSADNTSISNRPDAVNMSQQHAQIGANCMLDDWKKNLAIITANRTKDDELVIIHLGDTLWKERGEITAAHTCYLVAEANFESYSDTARMCLIGADHWSFPRTYASPDAIQRTELYEYSKVLGNSQSVLLPFQPYKIIYAYMLAELGKISDSLKYCQAVLKSLKTGRAPEVDIWKQLASSLEERIRTHQQGGYGTNLAPAKLVGKLLPFIDRSIHRMIGATPPQPSPSNSQSNAQSTEYNNVPAGPRVANSQSTMAMSSLLNSESMEPISGWESGNNRMSMHTRSISEPDFGRSPRQIDPATGASPDGQGKASISGGPSRFGRFGSQILQKTMGWVAKSRSDRQAKLGEKNKFYYDEKLKRWIEEGTDPPAEEKAPPPPPTTTAFQNGTSDYNTFKTENFPANGGGPESRNLSSPDRSSGIPPIPPTSNHFSARGRTGVRSRYVDTFNKGGGAPVNLFQTQPASAAKPISGANPKFFVPSPAASVGQTVDATEENVQEVAAPSEDPRTSMVKDASFSLPPTQLSSTMQRFPSMNSITPSGSNIRANGSLSARSRRTASWSGSLNDALIPANMNEMRPSDAVRMSHPPFMPTKGGNIGDDLHEVEL